ncbi:hypothetical protein GGR51DRAFT_512792 [Nemania sp. FL0031]|nr:hypothetical protein GGR51DRAFT_512792 [Nemania sp. FL0031]
MTDHNASSSSHSDAPLRPLARSSIPRSSSSYGSYDTGESSTTANLGRSSPRIPQEPGSDARFVEHGDRNPSHDAHQKRRSHKPRPSGGFLLSNNILNDNTKPAPKHRDDGRRRSRIPIDSRKGKSPVGFREDANQLEATDSHISPDGRERSKAARMSTGGVDVHDDRPRSEMAGRRRSMLPSLRPSSAPLDVDSTQIVNMALNLSQSRREASKRNISSPIPPRLAQLPDNTTGRSLKQHLQQQRRSSRGISPRADSHLSSRILSTPRISSPLQPTFDHDNSYTYHFSSSTLHRAQRAKEYLELMAQYRRLLLFLPPLKQEARSRPSSSSPMTSPNSINSPLYNTPGPQNRTLGRAYNPLQYIRNRKIRTRERKAIDGEAQGFGEVPRVTDWIDEVATFTAASLISESPKLPSFPAVEESISLQLPASNIPRPVSTSSKPKRPRFDWSIDPADMLADVYWLEQGNNRFLIEDRNYAKIYTPKTEIPQPIPQAAEPNQPVLTAPPLKEKTEGTDHDVSELDVSRSIKTDVETTTTSTRDRARQKLQDLRGIHHKHSSSIYSHHDFLRFRRGSSSESSDDESDRRRRARNGTISASGKDLLEKQMNDMLAKESQDEQTHPEETDVSYLKPLPAGMVTPEQASQVPHRGRSRRNSHTQATEHLDKVLLGKSDQTPPVHSGRASLEVPHPPYRSSMDLDPPKGSRNGYIPAIGMDLSPATSRPSSPNRNPFSKVKSIFRDRSRDRSRDREDRENDDRIISPIDSVGTANLSATTEYLSSPLERPTSKSSTRDFGAKATHDTPKSHRPMGSLSLRPEEQVGLRTIFKGGAKLDDMIRGGVSKMTDLIWKKDSDSESTDSDSDNDVRRGRSPGSALLSPRTSRRPIKNYGDIGLHSKAMVGSTDKTVTHEPVNSLVQVPSRPPSRSPRFEQLKPPRIDIRRASPDLSELGESNPQSFIESDMSEADSRSHDPNRPINRSEKTSKELQNMLSLSGTESSVSHAEHRMQLSDHQNWIIPKRTILSQNVLVSRREVARLRTLILCSGIKAMEISRRVNEPHLFGQDKKAMGLARTEIGRFMPDKADLRVPQKELFPTSARILSHSINHSMKVFEKSASGFAIKTAPRLQQQVEEIHNRVGIEFMDMTRRAADEADEVSHDIVDYQRLKAKSVVDTIDKMLRRRRRRFRWVRRAGWLALEWVLVGFMWYVWFVVMIARIVMGVGRGAISVVRWLLWL